MSESASNDAGAYVAAANAAAAHAAPPHAAPHIAVHNYAPSPSAPLTVPIQPTAPMPPAEQSAPVNRVIVDAAHESPAAPHWNHAKAQRPAQQNHSSMAATMSLDLATAEWARPAFEVDEFSWPTPVTDLVGRVGADLDSLANQLVTAARDGQQVVAISSIGRETGATTMMLCLAQRLASMRLKSALVDADFVHPRLASCLGMTPRFGWEDLAGADLSLAEVLVESLHDGLTLLPLRGPAEAAAPLADDLYWRTTLDALRARYRLVLLDVGPLDSGLMDVTSPAGRQRPLPHWMRPNSGVDAAIVVCDSRQPARDTLVESLELLEDQGIRLIGVAENFCPSPAAELARRHRPRAAAHDSSHNED
ncbi:MAG: hypothetical protein K8T25_00700 [Planctomycetia bacterium]|nr:hypothetical protein [Planctomycetia bacterium]